MSGISDSEREAIKERAHIALQLEAALEALEKNNDFKLLYKDYVYEEPVRLTLLLASESLNLSEKRTEFRKEIEESLIGVSRFVSYTHKIHDLADRARKDLEDLKELDQQ